MPRWNGRHGNEGLAAQAVVSLASANPTTSISWYQGFTVSNLYFFPLEYGYLVAANDEYSGYSVFLSGLPMTPLPSWNATPTKQAILDFVVAVTTPGHPDYVPPSERIATFDNDGTLWCEQPMQMQFFFLVDQIRAISSSAPELTTRQPFQAILEKDLGTIKTFSKQDLMTLFFETHTGMTTEAFQTMVQNWFIEATHPRFQRLFKHCTFQPMVELLNHLHANDFKCFIVSGGGVDFMRAIAEEIYGIPPERVIGSSTKTLLERQNGRLQLRKQAQLNSFNDRDEKVNNIHLHIGRRPILAAGNSDGDLSMLQYAAGGAGRRLPLLVHHDDADREVAYDSDFRLSPLTIAMADLPKGSLVVSMKRDFAQIFPEEYISPSSTR
jgi:phosphoserine phosphatase